MSIPAAGSVRKSISKTPGAGQDYSSVQNYGRKMIDLSASSVDGRMVTIRDDQKG